MWKDILKNIQITSQAGKQKDIVLPPENDDEEDCFEWFYKLIKVIYPSFELQRQVYKNQPENYWCRLKDSKLEVENIKNDLPGEAGEMILYLKGLEGDVPSTGPNAASEFAIFYTMEFVRDGFRTGKLYDHRIEFMLGDPNKGELIDKMSKFVLVSEASDFKRELGTGKFPSHSYDEIIISEREMHRANMRMRQYLGV